MAIISCNFTSLSCWYHDTKKMTSEEFVNYILKMLSSDCVTVLAIKADNEKELDQHIRDEYKSVAEAKEHLADILKDKESLYIDMELAGAIIHIVADIPFQSFMARRDTKMLDADFFHSLLTAAEA